MSNKICQRYPHHMPSERFMKPCSWAGANIAVFANAFNNIHQLRHLFTIVFSKICDRDVGFSATSKCERHTLIVPERYGIAIIRHAFLPLFDLANILGAIAIWIDCIDWKMQITANLQKLFQRVEYFFLSSYRSGRCTVSTVKTRWFCSFRLAMNSLQNCQ